MPRLYGESTHYNDPEATHQIWSRDDVAGYGVYGYYHSEYEAAYAANVVREMGSTTVEVLPYNYRNPRANWNNDTGVHPYVLRQIGLG